MHRARCNRHQDNDTFPVACPTCNRISLEHKIVRRTVQALLQAGFAVDVDNGGDTEELPQPYTKLSEVLKVMAEMDDEYLMVYRPASVADQSAVAVGWVHFVYGNDGYDVISDYTVNLDEVLAPINAWTDTMI